MHVQSEKKTYTRLVHPFLFSHSGHFSSLNLRSSRKLCGCSMFWTDRAKASESLLTHGPRLLIFMKTYYCGETQCCKYWDIICAFVCAQMADLFFVLLTVYSPLQFQWTAAYVEAEEYFSKKEGCSVSTRTKNPWLYSQRGISFLYYLCYYSLLAHYNSQLTSCWLSHYAVIDLLVTPDARFDSVAETRPWLPPPSQVVAVPDLFLTAVKLTHDKTGAQYLHAARDDSNNLFRLVKMCFGRTT